MCVHVSVTLRLCTVRDMADCKCNVVTISEGCVLSTHNMGGSFPGRFPCYPKHFTVSITATVNTIIAWRLSWPLDNKNGTDISFLLLSC